MTEKQERPKFNGMQFAGFCVKLLGYFALLFGVAFGMYWIRRHMIPHR